MRRVYFGSVIIMQWKRTSKDSKPNTSPDKLKWRGKIAQCIQVLSYPVMTNYLKSGWRCQKLH
ncbi:hypothetical protein RchiOBHm_Chr7g0211101 [Rosa chinensis]|uniref:Uncharacterized protein n=1 Tax=Rosa chinensis TaxID=74649 RepID=A0A2P6PAD2_ROSCH|nr:hypothetical protein RchiOBHm_Chr7g0211101 [Rosa chinensis]